MHLWVTSESLNERFNDIRDVCGLFYNGDSRHRNQYNAIVVTFPFTMYNHAVTYIISTFCFIVRVIRQWHGSCITLLKTTNQRRRKQNDTLPQHLTVTESLSSHEAVLFDEHTVIIRALGITIVIAGLSFMRILGGLEFTIFSTAVFLMNQHLYDSLLFRKPFHDFLLSIVFGNLFVISRVSQAISNNNDEKANMSRGKGTRHPVDEEMGMARGERSEPTRLESQAAVGDGMGRGINREESNDGNSTRSGRSSNGGEIIDTWALTSKEILRLSASTGDVTGGVRRGTEKQDSQGKEHPYDFHVCFGSEDHPGTIAFRGAVRSVAEKYSGKKYSMRARRDIKQRLKDRKYYMKRSSSPTDTWRRMSFFQVQKQCRECYEEEATKIKRELTLKNEVIAQESRISSEGRSIQDTNKSLDSLEREIIGSQSKDHSLMALLKTFTGSYDGTLTDLDVFKKVNSTTLPHLETGPAADVTSQRMADDSVDSTKHDTDDSNVLQHIRIISSSGTASTDRGLTYSMPSELDMDLDDCTSADETMTRSTLGSSPVPTYSLQTTSTELNFDERSKEEMETFQDLWNGFGRGSYVIENVESKETADSDADSARGLDMLAPSYSIWSELGDSFEIAHRYLQELAGPSLPSDASTIKSNSAGTHATDWSTAATSQTSTPLRLVTSEDVEQRRKMRLELQRDQIKAFREKSKQRQLKIDKNAELAKPPPKTGLFSMFRRYRAGNREKELEKIDELKELEEVDSTVAQVAVMVENLKGKTPLESVSAVKKSELHNEDVEEAKITQPGKGLKDTGTVETETETTNNKTEGSQAIDVTEGTDDETLSIMNQDSDWRESLHRKINELAGQDSSHFSSVYRQKKRELEAKFYAKNKDDPAVHRTKKVIKPPNRPRQQSNRPVPKLPETLYQLQPNTNPKISVNNDVEAPPPPQIQASKSSFSLDNRMGSLLTSKEIECRSGDDDCSEVTFDIVGAPSLPPNLTSKSTGRSSWDTYFYF